MNRKEFALLTCLLGASVSGLSGCLCDKSDPILTVTEEDVAGINNRKTPVVLNDISKEAVNAFTAILDKKYPFSEGKNDFTMDRLNQFATNKKFIGGMGRAVNTRNYEIAFCKENIAENGAGCYIDELCYYDKSKRAADCLSKEWHDFTNLSQDMPEIKFDDLSGLITDSRPDLDLVVIQTSIVKDQDICHYLWQRQYSYSGQYSCTMLLDFNTRKVLEIKKGAGVWKINDEGTKLTNDIPTKEKVNCQLSTINNLLLNSGGPASQCLNIVSDVGSAELRPPFEYSSDTHLEKENYYAYGLSVPNEGTFLMINGLYITDNNEEQNLTSVLNNRITKLHPGSKIIGLYALPSQFERCLYIQISRPGKLSVIENDLIRLDRGYSDLIQTFSGECKFENGVLVPK